MNKSFINIQIPVTDTKWRKVCLCNVSLISSNKSKPIQLTLKKFHPNLWEKWENTSWSRSWIQALMQNLWQCVVSNFPYSFYLIHEEHLYMNDVCFPIVFGSMNIHHTLHQIYLIHFKFPKILLVTLENTSSLTQNVTTHLKLCYRIP